MPVDELIRNGILGTVLVLILLGFLIPKGPYDRETKKSDAKDAIIADLTDALRRLADKEEARRGGRPTGSGEA